MPEDAASVEPIAIVGLGLRFPGSNATVDGFAEFLRAGGNGISGIPPERWSTPADRDTYDAPGRIRATGGGFLAGIDQFDAPFFNISPKEARFIDPQQRLVLETAWEALESAGIDPGRVPGGEGGVYVGCSMADYLIQVGGLADDELDAHLGAGTAPSAIPGRLSHFLGWHGPSMNVDTACSSSLVTLHLAADALRAGACSVALAGGVNLIHHPRNHVIFSEADMLSADGRCKTFDAAADGYGRSEGCGMLVLKRLTDAQRDADNIVALLTGSSVRQDGASGGLTVPNGLAQADVMRAALRAAALSPADVDYVEAHGTGTPLGDPIEIAAINTVFGNAHADGEPLLVGSLKTNIGHMEAAAGVGGVIKTVLQLRDAVIYPHIGFTTPSPHIPWTRYRVSIPTSVRRWPREPRRAVVNAFGFAGTIASVVLEQAPPATGHARPPAVGEHVLTVSAKSEAALRRRVAAYSSFLAVNPDTSLPDLCHTSNARRAHFDHRFACSAPTVSDLVRRLDARAADEDAAGTPASGGDSVAFLFTGQGAQYPGMGRALYRDFACFRASVDECDELFEPHLGSSVKELLLIDPNDGGLEIHQTFLAQPTLFVLEYSLARLWMSWGVLPSVLIGHSIGELVAATVAGLFSLPDAVRLAATRGRIMQSVSTLGGMAAVRAARTDVAPHLEGLRDVGIAAVNAPAQCVISGGRESLARVIVALQNNGLEAKPLAVSHAFHSPLMSDAAETFGEAFADICFQEPTVPFISNITGEIARHEDVATPRYWARHITEPVDFVAGVRSVEARGRHVFVEMGPSATLVGLGRQSAKQEGHTWVASINSGADDGADVRRALARCYMAGLDIDWQAYHRDAPGHVISLPGYPFERKGYWLPSAGRGRAGAASSADRGHELLGTEVTGETGEVREFRAGLSVTEPAWLADHVVLGQVVFPGTGYVEIALAAQDAVFGTSDRPVMGLRIYEPLLLADDPTDVHTRVRLSADGTATVDILSRLPGANGVIERQHATATLGARRSGRDGRNDLVGELEALAADDGATGETLAGEDLYVEFAELGLAYGPAFRRIRGVRRHGARVAAGWHRAAEASSGTQLPPYALDAAMQTLLTLTEPGRTYVPLSFAEVELYKKPKGALRSIVRLTGEGDDLAVDILVLEDAEPVVAVRGVRLAHVTQHAPEGGGISYAPSWVVQDRPAASPGASGRRVLLVHPPPADAAVPSPHLTAEDVDGAADLVWTEPEITDVAWFWRAEPGRSGLERLRAESEYNFSALLQLIQEMEALAREQPLRIWLVTAGGQWLDGDDAYGVGADALAAGSLWGFGRVMANEYPAYRVTLVDLEPSDLVRLQPLLDEVCSADAGAEDVQLAFRGDARHVLRLLPADRPETQLVAADRDAANASRPATGETYLVTGGLGGLGLVAARKLVEAGARHLTLVSRRVATDETVAALRAQIGEEVGLRVLSGDIADAAHVARIVREATADGQRLGGVVHAAGVLADAPIATQDWDGFAAVLSAKMYGSWLLHQATLGQNLRFFVGYSSSTALLGTAGQSNYAAANSYLDLLMHWRRGHGEAALAVNWGPWADVGMAARMNPQQARLLAERGFVLLDPDRGMRALFEALARPHAQVVVADIDWERFAATQNVPNPLLSRLADHRAGAKTGIDLDSLLALDERERELAVIELVRTEVAAALYFDAPEDISIDATFIELGVDSLLSVEFKNALEATLRIALSPSLIFDYPSVRSLGEYIAGRLPAPAGADVTELRARSAAR